MNQTDLIQNIIAAEHQAQAMTQQAKAAHENLDASIAAEIDALQKKYQADADAYLQQLEQTEHENSAQYLTSLDSRLAAKLEQIETIYKEQKDQWIESIFERVVGKAGG